MAERVCAGVRKAGADCDLKPVSEANVDELKGYDGIIFGSPTYYGNPAAELKQFIDASVKYHGQLTGKVGGAFACCGVLGGGAETTVRALIDAMLIHGMIVQGTAKGGHFGPIAVSPPNEKSLTECEQLGERVAELVKRLAE
jgi:NAD(P)H dehydrogenase (quinone)